MGILLGAIGDDFTGSTDLALTLCKNGMPTVQYIGVPSDSNAVVNTPAAVVALKSRTLPVNEAVAQSLAACQWLLEQGARQIFFKYCSTFDSTPEGNIGQVAEALLNYLDGKLTIACPAFCANDRTVYQGHLFVGNRLLSESSMRDHPLTPMTDADLVRLLGKQLSSSGKTGLVPLAIVAQGPSAIQAKLNELSRQGLQFMVVDAVSNRNLIDIGTACAKLKLITGGSGVAIGLPDNFRKAGMLGEIDGFARLSRLAGPAAVIAGSCSAATRSQLRRMANTYPALKVDPIRLAEGKQSAATAAAWAADALKKKVVLIYSSDDPQEVTKAQEKLGVKQAGEIIERALAEIARKLYAQGVRKMIVAGGETSGAVVEALGVSSLHIGPEIEPGVPWTFSEKPGKLYLALKSGNFGGEDFFEKAFKMLS